MNQRKLLQDRNSILGDNWKKLFVKPEKGWMGKYGSYMGLKKKFNSNVRLD